MSRRMPRRPVRIYNEGAFAEAAEALVELVEGYLAYDTENRAELDERVREEELLPLEKGGLR